MDVAEICLRIVGAFYAFAGYAATRAGLTSYFIDRAIAAIAAKKPTAAETAQALWLLCAASVILFGGVALVFLIDIAAWLFLASCLMQAVYLFAVAPRYFDAADPPDAAGRRQSTNAFVLYCAATAFVVWGVYTGKLVSWLDVPLPVLAICAGVVVVHIGYVIRSLVMPAGRNGASSVGELDFGGSDGDFGEPGEDEGSHRLPSESRRVQVMAKYYAHPLWALDDGLYGDFPPEDLGLSPELTRDLNAWAEAYMASLNLDDHLKSHWSEEQFTAHDAEARPLAVRLARERPDLMIYVQEEAHGVVEVHADETI